MIERRSLLLAVPALALGRHAEAAEPILRAGDQKGGTQSVMKAADALGNLSYRLEWNQFAAAAPLLEALNADAVDLAFAGDAPTTFALAAGLRGRIIAATRGSGASTAIVVPKASAIRSVGDLKGRSIATNRGSIGHALVLSVAEAQGWAPSDYNLVNLLPSEAKSALSSGAVDAWCSWGVYIAQARLVDEARVIVDGSHGILTGLSYLVATDRAIGEKRAQLLDFSRRLVAARQWAANHQDEYARVLAAEIGVSPAVARLTFDTEVPLPVSIDEAVIADQQRTADRYLKAGVIRGRLDARQVFDASFNEVLGG
jgi:sulfonate transport system substrate-binding protein